MIKAILGASRRFPMALQMVLVAYVGVLCLFGKRVFQIQRPDFITRDEPDAIKDIGNTKNIPSSDKSAPTDNNISSSTIPPPQNQDNNFKHRVDEGFIALADRRGTSPFYTNMILGEYIAQKALGYENTARQRAE